MAHNKRIKGTITSYEPIDVAVMIEISWDLKKLLKGTPYPNRSAAGEGYSLTTRDSRRWLIE